MKKNILFSFFLTILVACGTSPESSETANSDPLGVDVPQGIEEEAQAVVEAGVSLNNGEVWEANPETTEGVANMILISDAFTPSQDTADYRVLEKELHTEFSLIFKRCTMKGEAHNQLHNYLMPIKRKLGGLLAEDVVDCQTAHADLNVHLSDYKRYFK